MTQIVLPAITIGVEILPIHVAIESKVYGLPLGLIYNPNKGSITGIPSKIGHYGGIILDNNTITEFSIDVIPLYSIVLGVSVKDGVGLHQLGDTITYVFNIKNIGSDVLHHVVIDNTILGKIKLIDTFEPHCSKIFEYKYSLNIEVLEKGCIMSYTCVSGSINDVVRITSNTVKTDTLFRGHDKGLYIKLIDSQKTRDRKHNKYTFMIVNCSHQTISDVTILGKIRKSKFEPDEILVETIKMEKTKTKTQRSLVVTGTKEDYSLIGNTFFIPRHISTSVSLQVHDSILIAKTLGLNGIGNIKFYDGLKCIGKSVISNGYAKLDIINDGLPHYFHCSHQGPEPS